MCRQICLPIAAYTHSITAAVGRPSGVQANEHKRKWSRERQRRSRQQWIRRPQATRRVDRKAQGRGRAHRRLEHEPDALRAQGPRHRGDGLRRAPRERGARIHPRRDRARHHDHPREHQPPRARADVHRRQFALQDQREHRQLRDRLQRRRGATQAAHRRSLRRRHRDGPLHRRRHPDDPRGHPAPLARTHRHGASI